MTLVDTNVLLDLATGDPRWTEWSIAALSTAARQGPLLVNDVVYAELSVRYDSIDAVEAFMETAGLELVPIPREALFLAGKAFARYRRAGGTRTGVLPDFFVGAHAAAGGLAVLTRDARRYRSYFPSVRLISPEARN